MPMRNGYRRRYNRRRPYGFGSSLYRPRMYGVSLRKFKAATGNADRYLTILNRNFTLTSSVGANIALSLPFSGVSAASNWSSLAGLFSEFRVEAITVRYFPALPNSTLSTFTPAYMYFDADGIIGTTLVNALEYPSVVGFDLSKSFQKTFTIQNTIPARTSYYSTTTPGQQTEGVGLVAEGLSTSQTYGNIQIQYYVTFRGGN